MATELVAPADKMAPFGPIRSIRLYESIIDQIANLIREGHISVGDRFPPERKLEKEWRVSRPVLREAFRVLEVQGVVETRAGSGRYLRSDRLPASRDLRRTHLEVNKVEILRIWEAREALESKAAELAAIVATVEQIDAIERPVRLIRQLEAEDFRLGDYNLEIHQAIARASGNPILQDMILDLLERFRPLDFKNILDIDDWKLIQQEHEPILDAIRARNPELARQCMVEHFRSLCSVVQGSKIA
ncbi:MAG: FadR family transcriptional regulator [Rhodospirillales bacterium]|jgi:GntR family transcriptional regulator, transcriptional repressor for pyruvate dehydrogenase complex|nr:FadR family transcriptional regulator [Rhodospirillales bacterium]